ncbi:hypothetical protein [Desulfuromonas acetoxidans]|uniref:hypothetical protein n=1 Tax=Desulfuromonas acetoxidans TaxID=891 RepID=UPI0002F25102|nr:hypothetical protein [Desulfuromonas acetoxidans]MBF0646667.1 hypothetical protein [Desulfuromonas acetoxidans]NVD25770.1 hypothetical protein [Desulfuromonas acetoxidans]NVE17748.1 hypothetical protein [Desulfuromonas acetoxidans]
MKKVVCHFRFRFGLTLVLFGLGFALYLYGGQWLAVDRCLDAGGVYDYDQGQCVFE